ncbi:MAG TPA: (2Fe-2S)-binding protein [Candidatus Binataceae bacterium]|nr:(2Fe-2S)-binding protein [Candidatus Binataceae bacterium]
MARRRHGESAKSSLKGLSRRDFLKSAGFGAAGLAGAKLLEANLLAAQSGPAASDEIGPGPVPLKLNVNGTPRAIAVEPRTTLAQALRENLGLTGTKVVCDRGACSACTVWLDATPVNACMVLAVDVGKRRVTTIEGLAPEGRLHPVQAAFVAHDATQCGYCTPGMVMSCAALLARNANPSLDDVKRAVSGNLCRCGTYPKVFAATLTAAETQRGHS